MRSLTFSGMLCFQSCDRHFNPISIAGSAQFSIFPAVASNFTFYTCSPPFPSLARSPSCIQTETGRRRKLLHSLSEKRSWLYVPEKRQVANPLNFAILHISFPRLLLRFFPSLSFFHFFSVFSCRFLVQSEKC